MTTIEEVPEELIEEFQVEELEERVEFSEWGCTGEECSEGNGEVEF